MKKSILALFVAIILSVVFLAGCNGTGATPDEVEKVENKTEVTEAVLVTQVTVTFNAFTNNGVEYKFMLKEESGNTEIEKSFNTMSFTTKPGENIEDVINNSNYSDMVMDETLNKFLGFMEYKMYENEDGAVTYEKLSGDKLYSVAEVLEKSAPEYNVVYIAKWENISDDYYAAYGY